MEKREESEILWMKWWERREIVLFSFSLLSISSSLLPFALSLTERGRRNRKKWKIEIERERKCINRIRSFDTLFVSTRGRSEKIFFFLSFHLHIFLCISLPERRKEEKERPCCSCLIQFVSFYSFPSNSSHSLLIFSLFFFFFSFRDIFSSFAERKELKKMEMEEGKGKKICNETIIGGRLTLWKSYLETYLKNERMKEKEEEEERSREEEEERERRRSAAKKLTS